jgi:hypothetical protein
MIIIQFDFIHVFLSAKLIAQRPITKLAQVKRNKKQIIIITTTTKIIITTTTRV